MNETEQKQNIQKQTRTSFSKWIPNEGYLYFLIAVAVLIALVFFAYVGLEAFIGFMISWSAGFLGILTAFDLDRRKKQTDDDRIKKDFLALINSELKEIKSRIPPQTKTPLMLYPEVWDSFVSSGLIRLLSSEQVSELASVYKFVKGTQYEAEWVRRVVEKHYAIPEAEKERRQCLLERYKHLQNGYGEHGEQLSKEIEKILEKEWWK